MISTHTKEATEAGKSYWFAELMSSRCGIQTLVISPLSPSFEDCTCPPSLWACDSVALLALKWYPSQPALLLSPPKYLDRTLPSALVPPLGTWGHKNSLPPSTSPGERGCFRHGP